MGVAASLSTPQPGLRYPGHEHGGSEHEARAAEARVIAASRSSAEKEKVQRFLQVLDEYLQPEYPFVNEDNIKYTKQLEEYYKKNLITEGQYNKYIMNLQNKKKTAITFSGMNTMNNTNAGGGGYLSKKQRKNKSRKNKNKSHKNKSRKTKKH